MNRHLSRVVTAVLIMVSTVTILHDSAVAGSVEAPKPPEDKCGDCNHDGELTIDELITTVRLSLARCPTTGACCGDCNGDGYVTINEVVSTLKNLSSDRLSSCGLGCFGPCYSPVKGDPPCPCEGLQCTELPSLQEPDRTIYCNASLCRRDNEQFRSCMLLLHNTTDRCFEEALQ